MAPRAISDDLNGHGTSVAGLVAADTDNGRGVASLNERGAFIRVRSYPALAARGAGADDVAQAIQDATAHSVDVINLSFSGSGQAPGIVRRAVKRAQDQGIIVVVAAGNGAGDAGDRWPANLPSVLVVGATHNGAPATFSKTTYRVAHSVWAPGEGITSLTPGDGYGCGSRTSLAAPMVSGTLATMRALCPQVSAANAIALVEGSGPVIYGRGITPLGRGLRADTAIEALFRLHPECDASTSRLSWGFDLLVPPTYYETPHYYAPPEPIYTPPEPTYRSRDTGY